MNEKKQQLLKTSNQLMIGVIILAFLPSVVQLLPLSNENITRGINFGAFGGIFGIVFQDHKIWKENNVPMCSKWWGLIFPAYLWKRCKFLGIKKTLFFVWLALTVLAIVLFVIFPPKSNIKNIEKTACDLTTKILTQQYNLPQAHCIKSNLKYINDNMYKGTSITSINGQTKTIKIKATLQKNNMIFTEIIE